MRVSRCWGCIWSCLAELSVRVNAGLSLALLPLLRQPTAPPLRHALNAIHIPIALGAMALLPLLMAAGLKWSRFDQPALLAGTIAAAVLVNAFVCGALANPHDRYGARLTWLAPLVILLGVIRLFRDGMKVPTAAGTVLPRR